MAKSRREKTLADYVVIAISPALIMTLVGSLVFFLLELSYRGDFELRVRWIMFWFVVGAVLVARIAIQEGRQHASAFGGGLVLVVGLAVVRFVDNVNVIAICWGLLAIIWCCAWKLTWDCTLIDDDEDASGEGLLEAAGLVATGSDAAPQAAGSKPAATELDGAGLPGATVEDPTESRRKPHAPGRWVVYFSLAALPIFGVGQLLIPMANSAGRAFGFQLLAIYVASALGLLLTTSFLGLRRYLRQRKLQMPVAVTASWLAMGTGLAVALLLFAVLIPRPQGGEYTLTALIDKIDAKAREASRMAVLGGDKAQGEGRRIGEQDQKANKPGEGRQPQQQQAANGQQPEPGQGDGKQEGQQDQAQGDGQRDVQQGQQQGDGKQDGQQGQAQADGKQDGQQGQAQRDGKQGGQQGQGQRDGKQNGQQGQAQRDGKQGQGQQGGERGQQKPGQDQRGGNPQKQNQPDANAAAKNPGAETPSSQGLLATLAPFVKWIIYGLMAAVVLFFVVRYWSHVLQVLSKLWAELLSLFGFKSEPASGGASADDARAPVRLLPFAAYENPFANGAARRMSPAQLVRYTFEALEAWAREEATERSPEQTPLEFAQELGRRVPALAKDVTQTAQFYVQIAYAGKTPPKDSVEVLEQLWRRMQAAARV